MIFIFVHEIISEFFPSEPKLKCCFKRSHLSTARALFHFSNPLPSTVKNPLLKSREAAIRFRNQPLPSPALSLNKQLLYPRKLLIQFLLDIANPFFNTFQFKEIIIIFILQHKKIHCPWLHLQAKILLSLQYLVGHLTQETQRLATP